jgi:hypothetical protein
MIETNYSFGFETDSEQLKKNDHDHRKVCSALYRREVGGRRLMLEVDESARSEITGREEYEDILLVRTRKGYRGESNI